MHFRLPARDRDGEQSMTAREEAGKTAESVGAALSLAMEELKNGYERLRKRL